jgi:hypothetical protein
MPVQQGEKYGRLTPLYVVGKTSYRAKIWHCQCDCGNFKDVPSTSLASGNTRSCGCLNKETITMVGEKTRFKKGWSLEEGVTPENTYELSGEYGIGYTPKGEPFYFDIEDYNKIKDYLWYTKEDGYLICQESSRTIRMNRLIMNCTDPNKDVHHKNHMVNDNRKHNLEICEHYQNMIATKTYSNNTSGRKGVYWDKSRNKWMVLITANKKTYHIGRYENFEDAVKAREEAEKIYHQEFHYDDGGDETK